MGRGGGVVSFCFSDVVFSREGLFPLRSGFRVAGLRMAMVFSVLFECCPPCPPGVDLSGPPGGDAGSISSLIKSVGGNSAAVCSCCSVWVGFRGRRSYRCVPVELGGRYPMCIPVYVLCRVFQVSGANDLKSVVAAI